MKKIIITLILIIFAGTVFILAKNSLRRNNPPVPAENISTAVPAEDIQNSSQVAPPAPALSENKDVPPVQNPNEFLSPLDRAAERVTKKPFGIYITPKNSPVQPERFQGYHTGTDFEIFPEELNSDVPISAICAGKIVSKRTASGYGGVFVQSCAYNNQPITVVYGHLKISSISKNAGDDLNAGEEIGILGKAYSSETDGERKHLHLGIHKSSAVNILGYVGSKSELSGWIDSCSLVCK